MTLTDIIVDVLAAVHPTGEQIAADNVAYYLEDDQYADEILRIPGAVNRALADMELKRILPGWGKDTDGRLVVPTVGRVSLGERDSILTVEPGGALPDRYGRLIEHYTAGELLQTEEPSLGAYYRNLYEQGCELARLHEVEPERQERVDTVYGLYEW